MKFTEQKTKYLLIDFAGDIDGFNAIILQLNDSFYDSLKKGKGVLEQFESDELNRIELDTTAGRFVKIDVRKESLFKEWFFTHKGRLLFLDGNAAEIENAIQNFGSNEIEQTLSIVKDNSGFSFYISSVDRMFNSTLEYTSRNVPFTAVGL